MRRIEGKHGMHLFFEDIPRLPKECFLVVFFFVLCNKKNMAPLKTLGVLVNVLFFLVIPSDSVSSGLFGLLG